MEEIKGWQLRIFDNGVELDLGSENACKLKLGQEKVLELRYVNYENETPDIQINMGDEFVTKTLDGRFLKLMPIKSGHNMISLFIPHKEDNELLIDTIEFMTFDVEE